jgi:molybdopterin-synthase adenylyltransferase
MENSPNRSERLYAHPLQVVRVADGAIVRRGLVRLHVRGADAADVLLSIVQGASRPNGSTRSEIANLFNAEMRPAVDDLVEKLVNRRLFATVATEAENEFVDAALSEEREDVFLWTFGTNRAEVSGALADRRIAVIGVNTVSRTLARSLRDSGFTSVSIVDHPLLRSIRFSQVNGKLDVAAWSEGEPIPYAQWAEADDPPDCLVATSDFGGLSLMREWNEFCVKFGIAFFPAVLHDMTGYAGPLVLPGQTACFECFWQRQNSNLSGGEWDRGSEYAAFQGQVVDGFHHSMAAILGHVAAFELFRFYSTRIPGFRSGTVLEIDLLGSAFTSRRLLKIPRCPVCGVGRKHSKISIERNTEMPGNPFER